MIMKKRQTLKSTLAVLFSSALLFPALYSADDKVEDKSSAGELKGVDGTVYSESPFYESGVVMSKIDNALKQAVLDGRSLDNKDVVDDILNKLNLTEPKAPLLTKSSKELAAQAKQNNSVKFNEEFENKVRKAAEREAEKKFPLTPVKTHVEFTFQQGPKTRSVKGTFVSAGARSIRVNDMIVAYVDMDDKLRSQFDEKFNKQYRDAYVYEKISKYLQAKLDSQQREFVKLMKAQDEQNEQNGYVYVMSKHVWATQKDYFNYMLPIYAKKSADAIEKMREEEAAAAAKANEEAAKENAKPIVRVDDKTYQEVLAAQRSLTEKVKSGAGVDALQGFDNAVWGTSRKNVKILFSRKDNFKQENERDTVLLTDDLPYRVDFYYDPNTLEGVIEYYAVADDKTPKKELTDKMFDAMIRQYHKMYGKTYEEKALNFDNFAERLWSDDVLPTPGDFLPKDKSKIPADVCYQWYIDEEKTPKKAVDGAKANDNLYVIHWVGHDTLVTLLFTYDDAAEHAIRDFYIVKEKRK